jgi:hypothetical protein
VDLAGDVPSVAASEIGAPIEVDDRLSPRSHLKLDYRFCLAAREATVRILRPFHVRRVGKGKIVPMILLGSKTRWCFIERAGVNLLNCISRFTRLDLSSRQNGDVKLYKQIA